MKVFGFTFGEKNDNEISNQEIIEEIIIDNKISETKNIEDNSENESNFFASIYNSTSSWTSNLGESIAETFNSAKERTGEAYNNSINYISETSSSISNSTKDNFVSIKDKIGETYEQVEIKNNFYLLLDFISIPIVVMALQKLSIAVPLPPVKVGIIVLIGLLMIFEEHKKNTAEKSLTTNQINEKTNFEVSELLKNVDLKSIISTLQPYEKQIPYGKQVFFILKLFT